MGKSNKFDYSNRCNSGAKLGQIIGSALQKEAEKVQKDAERHLQKARKQSTDSSSTATDTATTTHVVDLIAPGKDLRDDGVYALIEGLESALRSGTRQVSLVLVELDLSGNCITAASLARLAPVLELAKHHLKTLNLANNHIKVETAQQAMQWEVFLRGFRDTSTLRTLNLSDNNELGRRALEVFARVYTAEQNDFGQPGALPTLSMATDGNESAEGIPGDQPDDLDTGNTTPNSKMNCHCLTNRIRGLRSIPYITLHNVGLDDAGAMWFSYILQYHCYPTQLIPEAHATQPEAATKPAQHDVRDRGIEWARNDSLGKEGIQLLEKAEMVRRQALLNDHVTSASPTVGNILIENGSAKDKRKSVDSRPLKLPEENRRASVKSVRTSESEEHEVSELESARKKIKRAIIAHDGQSSVELWSSALNFVCVSRHLLYLAPSYRQTYTGPPLFRRANVVLSPAPSEFLVVDGRNDSYFDTHTHTRQASYASKLAVPQDTAGQSTQMLTDIFNVHTKPTVLQKATHRKGAFGGSNGLQTIDYKLNRLKVRNEDPLRFAKYQEKRIAEAARDGRGFRDMEAPCHLPIDVMKYLVGFVMTERETEVMNERQKEAALRWGQRRETLTREREWLRKDESAQVLMLLDSIDCLAYGQ